MSIVRKEEGVKLSKTVLDLKFMKKSKEKREILEDAEERQQLYQGQLNLLHEGADKLIMLNSYYECTTFLPCRLSFGGFNPEIEKLNEDKLTGLYKVEKKEDSPDEKPITGMEADLDEEELAAGGFLGENIRKKFGIKRKSDMDDYGADEESRETKKMVPGDSWQKSSRKLLTADIDKVKGENSRGDFRGRGRGDFGGRGRGDFGGRGRGDFGGRGRGDSRGRGRGDSRGRGRGDSRGRGRGDSRGRGRGDSRGRGRGDSRGRGGGDSRGRGRGDFRGRGRGDFRGRGRGDFRGRGRGNFRGKGDSANNSYDSSFDITFDKSDLESSFDIKTDKSGED